MKIEELNWTVRTYHCIKFAGIDTMEQLSMLDGYQLSRIRNIGKANIDEIVSKVED